MQWSTEQQAIFDFFTAGYGNLVVRARAGTGKTTTIIEAMERAPERHKLLCAFNKKNADELSSRLRSCGARGAEARTLHSLGYSYLRSRSPRLQVDGDRGRALAEAASMSMDRWSRRTKIQAGKLAAALASKAKNCVLPADLDRDVLIDLTFQFELAPSRQLRDHGVRLEDIVAIAMLALKAAGNSDGTVDYDDMIWLPVRLGLATPRYDLVVVDEAQDMNPVQIELALSSCKPGGRIVVVGDDRQAIYSFRGASSLSIELCKENLAAAELPLATTYRCPRLVVELAQQIVPDYQAAPQAPDGEIVDGCLDDLLRDALPGDFVLGRTNASVIGACLRLLQSGRRARVHGKDISASILSLIERLEGGGSVATLLGKLADWHDQEAAKIKEMRRSNEEELLAALGDRVEVIQVLSEGLSFVSELVERVRYLFDGDGPAILCSTVHRAKGMESDRVFVLDDTLRYGSIEEDNIRYVAYTRAKKSLILIASKMEAKKDEQLDLAC